MTITEKKSNNSDDNSDVWVFGYGSLIWRPDFAWLRAEPAWLDAWTRRFWQGSHDHRGLPEAPGRVVTLVADAADRCAGMAYQLERSVVEEVFENLDYREKNGYQRFDVELFLINSERHQPGVVYIAPKDNFAYLGEASIEDIAAQIVQSHGPSGSNREYLFELAKSLRRLNVEDEHVFAIERRVGELLDAAGDQSF